MLAAWPCARTASRNGVPRPGNPWLPDALVDRTPALQLNSFICLGAAVIAVLMLLLVGLEGAGRGLNPVLARA